MIRISGVKRVEVYGGIIPNPEVVYVNFLCVCKLGIVVILVQTTFWGLKKITTSSPSLSVYTNELGESITRRSSSTLLRGLMTSINSLRLQIDTLLTKNFDTGSMTQGSG